MGAGLSFLKPSHFGASIATMDRQSWEQDALCPSLELNDQEGNLLSKAKISGNENFFCLRVC